MKITDKTNGVKPFSEVKIGEVFIDIETDEVAVYIKTDNVPENAVNLESGVVGAFDRTDSCRVVEAELIIR